jgi:hypothetical protein
VSDHPDVSDPSTTVRSLREWLADRQPTPPATLAARLGEVLPADAAGADGCLEAGEALLERLLADDCAARGSALDLLVVDALVTYAFEAAADDPTTLEARAERAMLRIAALGDERAAATGTPADAP